MIHGCPNPNGARKLIDYLLSPEVELKLAKSKSGQIPLKPDGTLVQGDVKAQAEQVITNLQAVLANASDAMAAMTRSAPRPPLSVDRCFITSPS